MSLTSVPALTSGKDEHCYGNNSESREKTPRERLKNLIARALAGLRLDRYLNLAGIRDSRPDSSKSVQSVVSRAMGYADTGRARRRIERLHRDRA